MSIIIEIDQVRIMSWRVNLVEENVHIDYDLLTTENEVWKSHWAIFWLNMPEVYDEDGNPTDPPPEWYNLPASYWDDILALTTAATAAITNRELNPE